MAVRNLGDGKWQSDDGNIYDDETTARTVVSGAGDNVAMDTAATGIWFVVMFIKLYIWLIKKGILPCLAIAGGFSAFIGIFYSLITKTKFNENPTAFWIVFGVGFIVSMIAFNKRIKKVLYPMCVACGVTIVYAFLTQTTILLVPDYMWITQQPENIVGMKKSGDFRYSVTEAGDGIILKKYTGKKTGNIILPAEIEGLPLTRIEGLPLFNEEMQKKSGITSVIIPDTVTYIDYLFNYCLDVRQVTLPKNLKALGEKAFYGSGIKTVFIPEGVTDIGERAFMNCLFLNLVVLPKSMARMGTMTFYGCETLLDVRIPSGTKIQYGTYSNQESGGTTIGKGPGTYIKGMGTNSYFIQGQADSYGNQYGSFREIVKLSDISVQAIKNTGYTGNLTAGTIVVNKKITWEKGDAYEGDWADEKQNGKGKYTWANGDVYEGDFAFGDFSGKGKFTGANGYVYEGDFIYSNRHGKGKATYADGKVEDGYWLDGKFLGAVF